MPKLCEFETCRVRATYGVTSDPIRCYNHKEENMRLSDRLCKKCSKQANYNFKGLKANFCVSCKEDNMIDVNHPKCIKCKTKRSTYNYIGLKPEYCKDCKEVDMQDLRHNKCCCGKSRPLFNYEGLKSKFCSDCKEDGMINLVSKKCFCNKSLPNFNLIGLKPKYCLLCKTFDMIDVHHELCKSENCQTRGNKNYKGYCTNCYQNLFPLDPLTFQIRSKTKEIAVRDFINTKFEGFYHDKPLWYNEATCDCTTKRRIDHRKLINGTLLCIETDENQHKNYSKADEEARYHDLFMAYGGKFVFIRFNPDKYKDESGKSCNPMLFNRLILLEEEIQKQVKRIENDDNKDLLEVIELYYDKK